MTFVALQPKPLRPIIPFMQEFTVRPQPDDPRLTRIVAGIDHEGRRIETAVVMERPLTLFLNGREIVTMMTIGDHPDYLAVGYLLNQNMLRPEDRIIGIDYDDELETVVVRRHAMAEHPAGDLVDRVVTADVFHVDQRLVL